MQVPTLPHVFAFQNDVSLNARTASSLTTLHRRTSSFGPRARRSLALPCREYFTRRRRKRVDKNSDPPKPDARSVCGLVYQRSRIHVDRDNCRSSPHQAASNWGCSTIVAPNAFIFLHTCISIRRELYIETIPIRTSLTRGCFCISLEVV